MNGTEQAETGVQGRSFQIPSLYFNGFQIVLGNADISTLLLFDNEPTVKLSMSYTTAKTLIRKLTDVMKALEDVTGREIMTTEDAGKGLEDLQASGGIPSGR